MPSSQQSSSFTSLNFSHASPQVAPSRERAAKEMAEIKAMLTFSKKKKKKNASFPIGIDVENASALPPAIFVLQGRKNVAVVDLSRGGLLKALFKLKSGIQAA